MKDEKEDKEESGIADIQWQRIVKVLELLARHRRVTDIAGQFRQSEKWVRDQKNKALGFSPALVATLPPEVQDYLIQKRPALKAELEEFRQGQSEVVAAEGVSAIELARAKHWDNLAQTASKLDAMWGEHFDSGRVIEDYDYIVDVDSTLFESSGARFAYEVTQLLSHLKAEFPKEFEGIDNWRDLLKSPLPKGCLRRIMLVSKRRTFEGTCEICQGWQK